MKNTITINESLLKKMVKESVAKILNKRKQQLNENTGDVEDLILCSINNRSVYNRINWLAGALKKKKDKGNEIDQNLLINSSVMRKIQQFAIEEYISEMGPNEFTPEDKLKLRTALAEEVINIIDEYDY